MTYGKMNRRPDSKTEKPGRIPQNDAPRDALGVKILHAMNDAGLRGLASVHAGKDHTPDVKEDRSGDTDPETVQSGNDERPA